MDKGLVLLSTVVAPSFNGGMLDITPVEITADLLGKITRNLCGHPLTTEVLTNICPSLPKSEKAFWNGEPRGLAIRPRGGVRASAQEGDTKVSLNDLEAVFVDWYPSSPWENKPRSPCAGDFFNCPVISH